MRRWWVSLLLGALLVAAPAARAQQLVVTREDGGVLLKLELDPTPTWEVRWRHSVAGFEVRDRYRLEGGLMLLQDSYAPDFAAGLGAIPGRGRLEAGAEGGYWLREIDESVPGNRYHLRVGSKRVDHRLVHAGSSHSLSDLAAGERVTLAVIRPPRALTSEPQTTRPDPCVPNHECLKP